MADGNPRQREDVQAQKLEGEWILHDPANGSLHVVNEMAHFVWGLCDGTHSRSDMARRITETFEVPEGRDLAADLDEILGRFGELGILRAES